jgi:uncharacterized repeat protein (TIGR01451 family)
VTVSGTETEADDVGINTIVAVDDFYSTPVNTAISDDVSVNDTFEPGSTFSLETGPTNGSITFNSDGTFTYTPNNGFNGTETFTYEVCAPSPNGTVCDLAEVTITIADLTIVKSNSPNTPVVAGDIITYTTTVTGTGSAALTNVDIIDAVPAGTVFIPGSVTSTITHPTLTLGNPALVSEVFTATDTWTAPAGVTSVIVEAWGAGGASRNGTDRRGGAGGGGYARSVLSVTGGASYTVTVGSGGTTSEQDGGDSWFNTTGSVFAEGGQGGSEGNGGTANTGNDATFNGGSGGARGTTAGGGGGGSATATAAGGNGAAGSAGIGGAGGVGAGDGGDGGDNTQPGENGAFPGGGAGGSGNGIESINSGGNGQVIVHYIPVGTTGNPPNIASNWTLGPNSVLTVTFQVVVSDNPPAVITNTSTVSSDQLPDTDSNEVENAVQPVAADDAFSTPIDTPVDGDVSTNDSAPPGSTFNKLTDPANGSVTFNDDGTFTYTPDPGFNGTDTFTYEVCAPAPNGTLCDEATVTLTIADLTIVKSNTPDENTFVSPGDPITYTVKLTNTGSADLTNVSIEDIIPASTTYTANSVGFTFTGNSATSTSTTFDTPGAQTWTAPAGVTEVTVEVWGAGGSTKDGNDSRGGAGGGAYARSTLAVTPGVTYNLQVGDGPTAKETDGGGSWFNTSGTIFAQGGRKGGDAVALGGQAGSSIGDVTYSGGNGGARSADRLYGGGGGGSATPNGPGTNGTSAADGGPAGVGGTGTGDGGDGGINGVAGQDGQAPGGGGGGTGSGADDVSAGGDGQVIITYETFGTVSAPGTLASGWNLAPGAVLEITYEVTIDDPATEIVFLNTATVTSDQLGDIQSNEVRNDISGLQITTGPCWRTISIPNSGQSYADFFASFRTNNTDFGGLWTQGATGARYPDGDPNVFTMDITGENWIPITDLSAANVPVAGTGILISVFDEDQFGNPASSGFSKIAEFSGTENSAPVSVNLGTPSGTTDSVDGFSLLGNPFYSAVDFDLLTTSQITGNVWVYNRNAGGTDVNGNNGGWISWNGSTGDITDGIIASGQGFVVQNTNSATSPSVTFEEADKTAGGTFYGKENRKPDHIRMEIRGDGVYNSAWIQFSENGAESEIMSDDVVQFYPFESEYAVLSTLKSGKLMDIGHFPYPGENVQIPLTVETTTTDQLTITLTNLQYSHADVLYLHDTVTGRTIEIEEGMEYTFTPSGSPAKSVADCYSAPIGFAEPVKGKTEGARFYISSSARDVSNTLPSEYRLNQNYPNPFNPSTQITYQLPQQADVLLEVFDMSGRQIATLVNESVNAGTHTVSFDATSLSSGVYMYRLQAGAIVLTKKLTLIK